MILFPLAAGQSVVPKQVSEQLTLANSSNQQLTCRVNLQADEVAPQSRKGNSGRFRRPSIGFSGTCDDRVALNQ